MIKLVYGNTELKCDPLNSSNAPLGPYFNAFGNYGLVQIKPNIKPIYKALLFLLATAIIGEELAYQFGFYKMLNWKHLYGVPFYFVIYIIANKLAHSKTIAPIVRQE